MAAAETMRPGKVTWFTYLRSVFFYLHIALVTLVLGLWGVIFQVPWYGRSGVHRVASVWCRSLLWAAKVDLGLSYEIRGAPPVGDCIIGAKHQSFFDILIIARHAPERAFIMKKQILRVPIMGWFAWKAGCIPIDRSKGSEAMKVMLSEVTARQQGEGLGQLIVYPEGTRVKPGEKRRYKPGIGALYETTGLSVVPVATNVGLFWSKRGFPIRSGRGVVEYLPAIAPGMALHPLMERIEAEVEGTSDALMAEAGFVATDAGQR